MAWHRHDDDDGERSDWSELAEAICAHFDRKVDALMATIQDIKDKLDQLTTQEAGETVLGAGQVAVAQSDLDAVDAHLASLIDPAAAPVGIPGTSTGTTPTLPAATDPGTPSPVVPADGATPPSA